MNRRTPPWAIVANYEDPAKLYAAVFPEAPAAERTERPAPLTPLARPRLPSRATSG